MADRDLTLLIDKVQAYVEDYRELDENTNISLAEKYEQLEVDSLIEFLEEIVRILALLEDITS